MIYHRMPSIVAVPTSAVCKSGTVEILAGICGRNLRSSMRVEGRDPCRQSGDHYRSPTTSFGCQRSLQRRSSVWKTRASEGSGISPEPRDPSPSSPVESSPDQAAAKSSTEGKDRVVFLVSLAALVVTGVGNRILYKMALVPLGNHVFFLAQFQTFAYVAIYFSILGARYKAGAVTKEMMRAVPLKVFAFIGGIQALSQVLGFIGAAQLPGVTLPLLQQSVLFFNLALSSLVLKKGLAWEQILGVVAVAAGVAAAAWPSGAGASIFQTAAPIFIATYIVSMFFPALDSIIKEKSFSDARAKLNGQQLDIFVVNSFSSGFQALFVLALLPVITSLRGMALSELPHYLMDGAKCFGGLMPSCGTDCSGAPFLPILYVAFNLLFNISALSVLRTGGALVSSLAMASLTPLTIFAFTFSWPYLGTAPVLGANFALGSVILVAGLLIYNLPSWRGKVGKAKTN